MQCNGSKYIIKFGNLRGTCDLCSGIGHIKVKHDANVTMDEPLKKPTSIKVKRKYTKKIVPELILESHHEHVS